MGKNDSGLLLLLGLGWLFLRKPSESFGGGGDILSYLLNFITPATTNGYRRPTWKEMYAPLPGTGGYKGLKLVDYHIIGEANKLLGNVAIPQKITRVKYGVRKSKGHIPPTGTAPFKDVPDVDLSIQAEARRLGL